MVKKWINKILEKNGYTFSRISSKRMRRGFTASHLSRLAAPKTVIDVGVATGTPALYEAFPEASFILVEPLIDYQKAIDVWLEKINGKVYYQGVSSKKGKMQITVDLDDPLSSSMQKRSNLTRKNHEYVHREVEITTLDHIMEENHDLQSPVLLKIDTEGHELEVLKGAIRLLGRTEIVIAEVSIAPRFEKGYVFEDLIKFMSEKGFCVYDILNIHYAKREIQPRFADVVFINQKVSKP